MERFFTGFLTALSVPILILNVIGGLVGGIWLMSAGEWSLFLGGLAYIAFGAMIIGLLLMPALLFSAPAAVFAEKRKHGLFFLFGLLSLTYTYGLIAVSTYFVSSWLLDFPSAPLWATLLWLYAVVLAPWQYMASKEQDNSSTTMTTFFLALSIVALILSIGIFGLTLSQAFPILLVILSISLLLQFAFAFVIAQAEKQSAAHDAVEAEIVDKPKTKERTWGDIK